MDPVPSNLVIGNFITVEIQYSYTPLRNEQGFSVGCVLVATLTTK